MFSCNKPLEGVTTLLRFAPPGNYNPVEQAVGDDPLNNVKETLRVSFFIESVHHTRMLFSVVVE